LIKNNGPEWSGSFIELGSSINFSTTQTMKMKVLAPQAGIIVKLKLENLSNPAFNIEVDATTTVANAWEELSFTFNGINTANNYKRVVVFFNFGVVGTGEYYLFDDIQLDNTFSTPDFNSGAVSILPNPVRDQLTVRMNQPFEKVTVLSTLGQVIIEQAAQGVESQLSLSHLSKGMYVLAVQTTDGKQHISKLIKE